MIYFKKPLLFSLLAFTLILVVPTLVLGYGEAGTAPTCTAFAPSAPWLYYTEAVGTNAVKLVWDQNSLANSWTVAYGSSSGQYIWGIDRFGNHNSRSITIGDLPRGTYYFVVRANNDCMPGPFSNEQSVRAGGALAYVPSTRYVPPAEPKLSPTAIPGKPGVVLTPTPTSRVPSYKVTTPQPTVSHREGVSPAPTLPLPMPTPRPGFFQRIINFFLGLFR